MQQLQQMNRDEPGCKPSEMALLGALLQQPHRLAEVADIVTVAHWAWPQHKRLYELIVHMSAKGEPIDMVTLPQRVFSLGQERFGGVAYVASLTDRISSAANVKHYAENIRDAAERRELIKLARGILTAAYGEDREASSSGEIAARFGGLVARVGAKEDQHSTTLSAAVGSVLDHLEAGDEPDALSTGLGEFDLLLDGGLRAGELIIIGARPGVGKTSLVLQIAEQLATQARTGFFSLEMDGRALASRWLSSASGVPSSAIRRRKLEQGHWDNLEVWGSRSDRYQLMLNTQPGITLAQLRAQCKRWQMEGGLGAVVVDYLQLMRPDGFAASRERAVGEISTGLKHLALEFGIPVIALAQLNRSVETTKRASRVPKPSDLRDSGQLEQDADLILFLVRELGSPDAELHIAKQRNGQLGSVDLDFDGPTTRFSERGVLL